ncbi:TetR family transcriptional regulator [Pseudodesulfovibrio sp.]|uniref:TetR/AcrR family transcriptional regulator n=1 Tax=Pseudodesulfovibrio sp. TaxID=2035812 RepID=UPI00262B20EC|nr:TetR family transcriptional regulator [Pseudodesulfovibrio sp.]MDD3310526.1 TetR family transcriptional regulator [Pseudodesulfovibrio sp.]
MQDEEKTFEELARRRRIIRAAVECFGKKGVRDVDIDEIAARAGVDVAQIEEDFTCKAFLVCAAGADQLNDAINDYVASMPEASLDDKIMFIIKRRCQCLSEMQEEADIFYRLALEGEQPWSDTLDQFIWHLSVHFATLVEHSVRTGELQAETDVSTTVKTLVSIYLAGVATIGMRAMRFDAEKVLQFIEPQVRLLFSCHKS